MTKTDALNMIHPGGVNYEEESAMLTDTYRKLQQKDSENPLLKLMEVVDNYPVVAFSKEYHEKFVFDGNEAEGRKRYRLAIEMALIELNREQNN